MPLDLLKRSEKGAPLSSSEHDVNFTALETAVNAFDSPIKAADIAAAATVNLTTATGWFVDVTGTGGPITSFGGSSVAGMERLVRFTGATTITHNATSLILPGGQNILTEANDMLWTVALGGSNWLVAEFFKRTGYPVVNTPSDPVVIKKLRTVTQAVYNGLTPDANTIYFING